jgi:hypothetical protein
MKKQIAGALAFLGWSFLASACGLISGVSDDYTYERADGAADAVAVDSSLPSDAAAEARVGDAGPDGASLCPGAIPLGDGVSPKCHACFVANCCLEATRCNESTQAATRCNDYMKCLGNCKPPEVACRTTCQTKFAGGGVNQLTACRGECPATACAGQ